MLRKSSRVSSTDQHRPYDYLFKLIVVGNSSVGKSCLLLRFADDKFMSDFITTIGVDFRIKTLPVEDKIVKLQLWDTAGQERFRTIVSSYYRGANGVMVVYDVTNAKSFEAVESWYQEVTRYARANVPVLLVGNKADAGDSNRQVSTSQGEELAARLGMTFVETSAKTARGVQEAFHSIALQIKTEMETSRLGNNKTDSSRPSFSVVIDDATSHRGIMGNLSRCC